MTSSTHSAVFIGSDTLLIECGEIWRSQGHMLSAVVTSGRRVVAWARAHSIPVIDTAGDYAAELGAYSFDYLFAVTHLAVIPDAVITMPKRAAINFHDGPLPRYAGLNAPTWALIHGEPTYGITWHTMTAEIDGGDILKQASFEIAADETSLSLNTRCFASAIETFAELVTELVTGTAQPRPQPTEGRTYFGRFARPEAACVIDWTAPAATLASLVRAMDFGPRYPNTLGAPMVLSRGRALVVSGAEASSDGVAGDPGTVLAADGQGVTVACGQGALVLRRLREPRGADVPPQAALAMLGISVGDRVDVLSVAEREALTARDKACAKAEPFWTERLQNLDALELPYARATGSTGQPPAYREAALSVPAAFSQAFPDDGSLAAAFAVYVGRISDRTSVALAYSDTALVEGAQQHNGLFATVVPLVVAIEPASSFGDVVGRLRADVDVVRGKGAYLRNLGARFPELQGTAITEDPGLLPVGVAQGVMQPAGSVVQLHIDGGGARLRFDPARIDDVAAARLAAEFAGFVANVAAHPGTPIQDVELLSTPVRKQIATWNQTATALPEGACIHTLIETQVDRTPDAVAVACEDQSITYRQLDERANRLATHLRGVGVGPEQPVGIHLERSIDLVVATLAVLKAGGAYVPLDPTYPADRVALMIQDAHLKVVVTQQRLAGGVAEHGVTTVSVDDPQSTVSQLSSARPAQNVSADNLAYLIYTSGSTGKPKGVMLEHRHAVNFFVGMDARVPHETPGTWLAVTSLSFDISVLELLWTLARGFKVVVHADRARAAATSSRHAAGRAAQRMLEFSLFYFSADAEAEGSERYRLLLEGARFADDHGFSAVWTPERHFHAFGGLYPNPAVTGAAVAAITKNVGIRAGSVVLPLHHPVRVVEAWSIVDNISNGRVGVSVASGWQPNDFILMPENYKTAKAVMMRDVEVVRKLWRGEAVSFPGHDGKPVSVQTQPTPVQKEIPIWITTAGNAETFEMAGKAGANVLTHLLGQSLEKLAPKIDAYRRARAQAGFDPNTGVVSLMLHTFVGPDRAHAKEVARGPLKAYLSTSMDLIKDKAWAFPAFARVRNEKPGEGGDELSLLTPEEREGMLEFAFERYFETSGLFGTVEDALAVVQKIKAIGVNDVACLIDFGIPTQVVLDHLPYLDQVRLAEQSAPVAQPEATDGVQVLEHPFLTDVREHGVTHMQCTPSMARMFLGHEETRAALGKIQHVFLGGEALPIDLVQDLRAASRATITNMYGPTETTVWSTTYAVKGDETAIPIGTPIANTTLYVTDSQRRQLPIGVMGELWIGGAGVARGYWERPELTQERFVNDPFATQAGQRMYRTGDRARWRADGVMEFFGRADFQVKVRGYRIEPGEIEALVRKSSLVAECVVVLREDRPGDQRLVAYVVPAPAAKIDTQAIREKLRAELPEYMVPAAVVAIEELPLTPNRKVDRKALPAPEVTVGTVQAGAGPKPESEVQQQIASVWYDVLARDGVGLDDNFFDLGGHSLLVVRAHRKLQDVLGRPLALTDLYRFPTIRSLSGYLEAGSSGDSRKASERGARRRELLQRRGR